MSRVGFEPTTLLSERMKTVCVLGRTATVIGKFSNASGYFPQVRCYIMVSYASELAKLTKINRSR
jgi:hypothetical protein